MSTSPPVVVAPTPTSKVQNLLAIIQAAITGLTLVPGPVGADAGLAGIFIGILNSGLAAYQAETGKPLDLTKIPLETPVS